MTSIFGHLCHFLCHFDQFDDIIFTNKAHSRNQHVWKSNIWCFSYMEGYKAVLADLARLSCMK